MRRGVRLDVRGRGVREGVRRGMKGGERGSVRLGMRGV